MSNNNNNEAVVPTPKNSTSQRPDIVQWFNKETNQYVKFERATGRVLAEKVTAGPYKNIHLAKRRPHIRVPVEKAEIKKVTTKKTRTKAPPKPKKPKKINYLNNKDLMIQVMLSKGQSQMTDRLAHMLQTLALRYGRKGNFANYTYNEDMQAYAMMMLVRTWNSFNPEKSQNPFAFFTQCIKNSFIQFLNQEKRQRDIRDSKLVDQGLDPSYNYQEAHSTYTAQHVAADRRHEQSDDADADLMEREARDSGATV